MELDKQEARGRSDRSISREFWHVPERMLSLGTK